MLPQKCMGRSCLEIEQALRKDIFETIKRRFRKCLDPTFSCDNPAIDAHSVQRASALSRIAVNNHVYQPKGGIKGDALAFGLRKVGCRQASVFPGMCAKHDSEFFRPIDAKPLASDDPQQLFLLAYRAVTKHLHDVMEAAMRLQMVYSGLVSRGDASATVPDPAGMEAFIQFLTFWNLWKYREAHYDRDILKGRYDNIKHSIFKIENERPLVAASTFFFIDEKRYGQPFAALATNVVPLSDSETVVIFSYAKQHSGKARKFIAPVIAAGGQKQKYELSYLLINNAENWFISPQVVESWPENKRKLIERAFGAAFPSEGTVAERIPELMLFNCGCTSET